MPSLWLHPKRRPVLVEIERFRDYPHFFESLEQYGIPVPELVPIRWRALRQFLEVFDDARDAAPEFIRQVSRWIKRGVDVPPLLLLNGRLFDGRHRAWAAWNIGLKTAPVFDLTPYWGAAQSAARVYGR